MRIKDISDTQNRFGGLKAGTIFRHDAELYCKLLRMVRPDEKCGNVDWYNAINLDNGDVCYFEDRMIVESLAGHTLEILD